MRTRAQLAGTHPTISPWRRIVASLCTVLLIFASWQQASHNHGRQLKIVKTHASDVLLGLSATHSDTECAVCAAMAGAAPTIAMFPLISEAQRLVLTVELRTRRASLAVPFAMFSRPPPADFIS